MNRYQCLWYALDRWHEEGGYLLLARSNHDWIIPHVMHSAVPPDGVTHFVPHTDLQQPWHALFGFDGKVIIGDPGGRGRMGYAGMFLGTLILLVFGGLWAARNAIRGVKQWVTTTWTK